MSVVDLGKGYHSLLPNALMEKEIAPPPYLTLKGARSQYFKLFYLFTLIKSSNLQVGRAKVFYWQNHGHITNKDDF